MSRPVRSSALRPIAFVFLIVSVGLAPASLSGAERTAEGPSKSHPPAAAKSGVKYLVVDTGAEILVIRDRDLDGLRKKLDEKHERAVAAHAEAKRAARRERKQFRERSPAKPRLTIVRRGLATRDEALEARDRAVGKALKKSRKRGEKPAEWLVVLNGEEHQVVTRNDLEQTKKGVESRYREELAAYRAGRRRSSGKRAEGSPTPPKPPAKIKILATGYWTREGAEARLRRITGQKPPEEVDDDRVLPPEDDGAPPPEDDDGV